MILNQLSDACQHNSFRDVTGPTDFNQESTTNLNAMVDTNIWPVFAKAPPQPGHAERGAGGVRHFCDGKVRYGGAIEYQTMRCLYGRLGAVAKPFGSSSAIVATIRTPVIICENGRPSVM